MLSAAINIDSSRLLTYDGRANPYLRLCDAETGKALSAIKAPGLLNPVVAVSPDGKLVAAVSYNSPIRVREAASGRIVRLFNGYPWTVQCMVFSRDGRRLVTGTGRVASSERLNHEHAPGNVTVWDLDSGRHWVFGNGTGLFRSVDMSPDGRWVAGSYDRTVNVWDLETAKLIHTLNGHDGAVYAISFSSDGRRLVSSGADKTVRTWQLATARQEFCYRGHVGAVTAVGFSRDGERVFSGSADGTVKVWAATRAQNVRAFRVEPALSTMTFSPNGKWLAGTSEAGLQLWDVATGQSRVFTTNARPTGVAFSDDSLVAAAISRSITLWETSTGEPVSKINARSPLAFHPNGKHLAATTRGSAGVDLWEIISTNKLLSFVDATNSVASLKFSPDGRYLAAVIRSNPPRPEAATQLNIWDVTKRTVLYTISTRCRIYDVAFSKDSSRFAIAGALPAESEHHRLTSLNEPVRALGQIEIRDVRTGNLISAPCELGSCAYSVALSPNGKRFVAAKGPFAESGVFEVSLWDVDAGREVLTLGTHTKRVLAVAFMPNDCVGSAGADGTVNIWEGTAPNVP